MGRNIDISDINILAGDGDVNDRSFYLVVERRRFLDELDGMMDQRK